MYEVWISQRMKFSKEDKEACLETAQTLLDIARDAMQHSLLSLEGKTYNDVFLEKAVYLSLNLIPPSQSIKYHTRSEPVLSKQDIENLLAGQAECVPSGVIGVCNSITYSLSSKWVRQILYNYIIAGDYSGAELLKRVLITETIPMIADSANPHFIREYLASYFGEDFLLRYMDCVK